MKIYESLNRDILVADEPPRRWQAMLFLAEVMIKPHLNTRSRQRLCIARALILEPEILLLDEPTSSLDSQAGEVIESLLLTQCGQVRISSTRASFPRQYPAVRPCNFSRQ